MSSSIDHLHILCYRWGTRYGVEFVNRLQAMVRRHLNMPHTFHCVTDSTDGLSKNIEAHPLQEIASGNWNKLQTFKDNFLGLNGRYLVCMDLDLVVVGDLNFLTMKPEEPFMIGKNWAKGIRGNSSVYRVRVGELSGVWEDFIANPEENIRQHHGKNLFFGDQNWLNFKITKYAYFPDDSIVSFKRQCGAKGRVLFGEIGEKIGLTSALFGKATPPDGASIVVFHGKPNPPDVMNRRHGRWRHAPFVSEHWK